ncbi:MAG: ribosome assembly cofactor RimP [Mucilaginibacter polytrichastri]|nr:ribosome assembly cofactor RimP [Mucilaginibacter polytrichastri]
MEAEKQLEKWVEEWLTDRPDLFIVKVKKSGNKVSILMDGDNGITIQDCSRISRMLGRQLEENDIIDSAFTLEVSSPGADEPFSGPRQYEKNIGRNIHVKFNDGQIAEGKLTGILGDKISIDQTKKEKGKKSFTESREIKLGDIMETTIIFSFK